MEKIVLCQLGTRIPYTQNTFAFVASLYNAADQKTGGFLTAQAIYALNTPGNVHRLRTPELYNGHSETTMEQTVKRELSKVPDLEA